MQMDTNKDGAIGKDEWKGRPEAFARIGRVPVVIQVTDDMTEFDLPTGSRAMVAVYSDHFHHVAIMRRILLRMSSWQNYLYLDH